MPFVAAGTVGRLVTPKLQIAWDGTNFVDETANLKQARGQMKLVAPGSAIMSPRGIVDRMTLSLFNRDDPTTGRRYSPLNSAGPLYSSIQNGGAYHRPITFDIKIDAGSFVRIFTGIIKIPNESSPNTKQEATIDVDARSVDENLLQLKLSTSQVRFAANYTQGVTEADLIQQWLLHPEVNWPAEDMLIDNGMFAIQWGWLDDESFMEEAWALAAACGGRLYANPDGKIVFENMAHWLLNSTSTETFTRANCPTLQMKYDDSDMFSSVTVEASPRAADDEAVLWEPSEELQVPAGGTLNVTARLKYPAFTITGISYQGVTLGGTNISSDVSCMHVDYAQRVELQFTNANTTYAARLYKLQIQGQPVTGAPILEEVRSSSSAFWTSRAKRSRSLRSNVYIQNRPHAAAIAEFLRDTHEAPTLVYTLGGLQGLPERRLGSLITIDDAEIMGASRDAYITGITWSFSDAGFSQDLEAVDSAGIYKHTLDEYFVIGTDELNSAKIVFY